MGLPVIETDLSATQLRNDDVPEPLMETVVNAFNELHERGGG
ncbi:MAG: hypothetical protein ACRDLV_12455 [Solirubrobacteraceae bacterium]